MDFTATITNVSPTTYTIQLGDTRYGGTLDVLSGVLTVTDKYKKPPKSSFRRNNSQMWYVNADAEIATGADTPCISNKFRPWNGTESIYKREYLCFVNDRGAVRFNTTAEYESVDDMWDAIGEMEFVCKLATPATYQLTPTEVTTLLGENNIWADTGDATVTYQAHA